ETRLLPFLNPSGRHRMPRPECVPDWDRDHEVAFLLPRTLPVLRLQLLCMLRSNCSSRVQIACRKVAPIDVPTPTFPNNESFRTMAIESESRDVGRFCYHRNLAGRKSGQPESLRTRVLGLGGSPCIAGVPSKRRCCGCWGGFMRGAMLQRCRGTIA